MIIIISAAYDQNASSSSAKFYSYRLSYHDFLKKAQWKARKLAWPLILANLSLRTRRNCFCLCEQNAELILLALKASGTKRLLPILRTALQLLG